MAGPPSPANPSTTSITTATTTSVIRPSTALALLPATLTPKPLLKTGIPQLDDHILLGGFPEGAVIGLSTEDEDLGLALGLQTLSNFISSSPTTTSQPTKAIIITTLPVQSILFALRKLLIGALLGSGSGSGSGSATIVDRDQVKQCLSRISISRVFDVRGLEEVLTELESQRRRPEEEEEDEGGDPSAAEMVLVASVPALLGSLLGTATGTKERAEAIESVGVLGERLRGLKRTVLLVNSVNAAMRAGEGEGVFSGERQGRRSTKRPAYGQVFGRLVDLHLMGSRVLSEKGDSVWIVEVLVDEVGLYDLERMERSDREGRWGVVDFEGGVVK